MPRYRYQMELQNWHVIKNNTFIRNKVLLKGIVIIVYVLSMRNLRSDIVQYVNYDSKFYKCCNVT